MSRAIRGSLPHPGELITDNVCWILGAGASFGCIDSRDCCPLTRDLIDPTKLDEKLSARIAELINRDLISAENTGEALGPSLENTVDELRGLCVSEQNEIAEVASECLRGMIDHISAELTWAQTETLMDECGNMGEFHADNYLWLAKSCCSNPKWSVITLNYDDILDWSFRGFRQFGIAETSQYDFWEHGIQRIFERQTPSVPGAGVYIKAHGSLSLRSCQNRSCEFYRTPISRVRSSADLGIENPAPWQFTVPDGPKDLCEHCREDLFDLILPPGRNKTREEGRFYDFTHHVMAVALDRAEVWLLLGYSLPDYDVDMWELLKESLARRKLRSDIPPPKILVVDPNAFPLGERIGPQLEHEITVLNMTFSILRQWCTVFSQTPFLDPESDEA
jgi:hypothetical protein